MLVLSRKLNESIKIGDNIEIIIVEIKGDQIKLGVSAPKHVGIHRGEVYKEIQIQNQQAAESLIKEDLLQTIEKKKKK